MNHVVKFENTKQRRLSWEQEEALRSDKKSHKGRRDAKRGRREEIWEEVA